MSRESRINIFSRRRLLDSPFLRVDEHCIQHRRRDGVWSKKQTRMNVDRGNSVAAILHEPERQLLHFVQQFRFSTYDFGNEQDPDNGWMLELVAGSVDVGEALRESITREIREETGFEPTAIELIGSFYLTPGASSERLHLFYAEVSASRRMEPDSRNAFGVDDEEISTVSLSLTEFLSKIERMEIQDAKTITAGEWLRRKFAVTDRDGQISSEKGTGMIEPRLFGECVFAPSPQSSDEESRRVFDEVVTPAWKAARGVKEPMYLTRLDGPSTLRVLAEARVAFIDITGSDPAALYRFGARDALTREVTIPLVRGELPTTAPPELAGRAVHVDDPDVAIAAIADRLNELLRRDDRHISPIARAIPELHVTTRSPKPLVADNVHHLWSIAKLDPSGRPNESILSTRIGFVCGDLRNINSVDVWVNSENTFMEMGRMFDSGVSGLIRQMGAKGSHDQNFVDDVIQRELMREVGGRRRPVQDAAVFWTGPGELWRRGVKKVAHVAAVKPHQPAGSGYVSVPDLAKCVVNVLDSIETQSGWSPLSNVFRRNNVLRSIIFPLMGAGVARGDARIVSCTLISAAVDYLRVKQPAGLEQVLFLAYTDVDRELCQAAFGSLEGLSPQG